MNFQYSTLLPDDRFEVREFIDKNIQDWCGTGMLLPNNVSEINNTDKCVEIINNEDVKKLNCFNKPYFEAKTMNDIENDLKIIAKQPRSQMISLEKHRTRKRLERSKESQQIPEHLSSLLSSKSYLDYPHARPTRVAGEDCENTHNLALALLSVRIFKPIFKNQFGKKLNNRSLMLDKEFVVLSCQKLSTLRDSYCCIGDLIIHNDYSNRIQEPILPFNGHQELGAFLINDTFYVDERFRYSGSSIKNVDPIIEWADEHKLAKFTQFDMNNVRFEDLTIQLGFPYLYVHSPHCEHILVFNRIEFSPPDSRSKNIKFPLLVDWNENVIVDCDFCNIRPAKWLIYDCPRLPYTPFHVCTRCNIQFNYDKDMKKIDSFITMPIIYECDYLQYESIKNE